MQITDYRNAVSNRPLTPFSASLMKAHLKSSSAVAIPFSVTIIGIFKSWYTFLMTFSNPSGSIHNPFASKPHLQDKGVVLRGQSITWCNFVTQRNHRLLCKEGNEEIHHPTLFRSLFPACLRLNVMQR